MKNGIIVSNDTPETCPYCGSTDIRQDEDVLDTWFSSALWPFSTLGWPDDTDDLKTFYPTDVLITGFDIIFFWVARMIMMGLKFMKKEPFRYTYIHALIRDSEGQKMSKSKGNVVDPLKLTEAYGTDAVRFTLAAYAAQGRDIKFSEKRVEGYKHFINKIWNAARFISMNIDEGKEIAPVKQLNNLSLPNRWILSRLSAVISEVNKSFEEYRFNDSASILYQFIWHELCDWYLEMIKPELYADNKDSKSAAVSVLVHVFETALSLLHPIMPYVTEELWQQLPRKSEVDSLCIHRYPLPEDGVEDKEAEENMRVIIDAVTGIRNIRGELNLPPSLELKAMIKALDGTKDILDKNVIYVRKLAKANVEIDSDIKPPAGAASAIKPSMEVFVPLKGLFDIDAEISRLNKEMAKVKETFLFIKKKLSNEDFINKAPKAVVEENTVKYNKLIEKIEAIQDKIDKLKQWKKS